MEVPQDAYGYDTTYVNGLNEDVAGTMSSIAPVGGDTTAPSKVIGLSVSPVSGSQLNLSWSGNPEPDVAHYNIYRGTTSWICCQYVYLILRWYNPLLIRIQILMD